MKKGFNSLLACTLCFAFVSGCGSSSGDDKHVHINFSASLAGKSFACGGNFEALGLTGSSATPQDLRFYVHNVALTNSAGESVPVELENDGLWQRDGLALIDFEDGTGACADEGTPETNTVIHGTVPDGDYTGVSFTLGVPFEKNHIDAQTAEPPQNLTALWWNWAFGFKFLKFDLSTTGQPDGWRVHLGSTGCSGNEAGAVNQCTEPNRVSVALTGFNPDTNVVNLNLTAFLDGSNIDYNTPETAPGCMSGEDPECVSLFDKLGLTGGQQSLFQVE